MGRGAVPEFSWWDGEKLGYIAARKRIYAPIYAQFVRETDAYKRLVELHATGNPLILRDFDAYDHIEGGVSLAQVINNPKRKCGHAFVLAMMLQGELEECLA